MEQSVPGGGQVAGDVPLDLLDDLPLSKEPKPQLLGVLCYRSPSLGLEQKCVFVGPVCMCVWMNIPKGFQKVLSFILPQKGQK